ncbi:OmpA family protein [Seonamhaeicola marinus]|uniref:OmpA family protein n=1 Tax=Seonamhaeicola marinus TaxID=1912246 RepID=A0A5D0I7Y7_9FLAO|nr:OmpA family protein [Seonamhaeicola marinus]TYA78527.1 OmpA family protein [Seonamhaeicola marinus]
MKKILSILTFMMVFSGFAQKETTSSPKKIYDTDLRKANLYFNRALYAEAIPFYEKVHRKGRDIQVVENLATCYYNTGDLKASARLYGYLVNKRESKKTYQNIFKYVQALKASGKYNDANSVLKEYLESNNDTEGLNELTKAIKKHENIVAIGSRYKLENSPVNTEYSEFGMVNFNDFLVYAAPKKEGVLGNTILKRSYGWNAQPFLDIYKIHKDSLHSFLEGSKSISAEINTKLHEGTVAFSKNQNKLYFTRNNYYESKEVKDDALVTHLKIYSADLVDGKWTNVQPLPFNGDNFSVEHPAMSPDGKRLYFASDMLGTLGSFDLFYVDINEDGTYGIPINLGSEINTKHREQFPFISKNGDLYFSSNGHYGFGGLDIFRSQLKGNSFQEPDNLGLPINSGHDDFSFYLEDASKTGFMASNRKGGKGSDDIYSFKETKPLIIEDCKQYIVGNIIDKETKRPIVNAQVTVALLDDNSNKLIAEHATKLDGKFKNDITCEITLLVKAKADGYKDAQRKLIIGGSRGEKNDASLELVSLASIERKAQAAKEKELQKQQERKEKERESAERQRLKEEADKIKKKEQVIASEPNIVKRKEKVVIETGDINFDYKLWYIRRDVKRVLKPVINLMKKYPEMTIEIGSHTDIRGHKAYNKELSQKRATSTKEYLVSQGISANRIIAIGYGESQPIQKCETEDACSEEQHETNRRSEFVITRLYN